MAVLRGDGVVGESTTFNRIAVREPSTDELTRFEAGAAVPRQVDVMMWHRDRHVVEEAVVAIDEATPTVTARREVADVRPLPGLFDLGGAIEVMKADPGVLAALAKRGVTDMDKVQIDPWPTGAYGNEWETGRRVSRGLFFYRENPNDNPYARPIDGLMVYVDHDLNEVVHIEDIGVWPIPAEIHNFDVESVGALRTDLKPIEVHQPEGVSFTVVDGNEVRWQNWRFRVLLDPTSGLVIRDVSYDDHGRERSILRRASLGEMVVPYGEKRPTQRFKNVFDAGELGLGRFVNSLTLGCDCLGEITYLDAVMALDTGDPFTVPNAICMHEEDFSILWKHTDLNTGNVEVRRQRRFVVSSIFTAGNYEYGFYWYFYLDGNIQLEVKLTGCLTPQAHQPGDSLENASLITPDMAAAFHQHLFSVRLEMAVDGAHNTVLEIDAEPEPMGPDNPYGNAFRAAVTRLETSDQAVRDADPLRSRSWRIVNESVPNRLGNPVGYKLLPMSTPRFMQDPGSVIAGRAGFARHHLWVTPTSWDERYSAGPYPTQSPPDGWGLPMWAARGDDVAETSITVWHTFGVTHLPRPEDFPVMPVEYCGFVLMPVGFFDRNPSLDVPPNAAACH